MPLSNKIAVFIGINVTLILYENEILGLVKTSGQVFAG